MAADACIKNMAMRHGPGTGHYHLVTCLQLEKLTRTETWRG